MNSNSAHASLRESADGSRSQEAAVELLIRAFRGRFAQLGNPWIVSDDSGSPRLEPEGLIGLNSSALSSGEVRFLRIVADIANGPLNDLELLDPALSDLVSCAVDHLAGRPDSFGAEE